tara:strand:+ start:1530 stop:1934 length:405 start_codon:yes stop_codon:yes gene_type:complete
MIKVYLFLFIIATFGSVGYGGYVYVTGLQQQVLTLRENQVKLEQAVAVQTATIARQKADSERQSALNNELSSKLVAAESGLSSLRKRFTQIDINQEAIVDPNGLEVRVNNAVGKLIGRIKDETTPDTSESVAAE